MKVVFLDLDGVINSQRSAIAFGGYPHLIDEHRGMFDEVAVKLISGIVKTAAAKVVLSSSWRHGDDWQTIGPALGVPIIDRTPSLLGARGGEIKHWLDRHAEVECYAIVDDDPDMLPEQMPFFVHTCGFDGFRWGDAEKLCGLLGIKIYDVNHPGQRVPTPSLAWE